MDNGQLVAAGDGDVGIEIFVEVANCYRGRGRFESDDLWCVFERTFGMLVNGDERAVLVAESNGKIGLPVFAADLTGLNGCNRAADCDRNGSRKMTFAVTDYDDDIFRSGCRSDNVLFAIRVKIAREHIVGCNSQRCLRLFCRKKIALPLGNIIGIVDQFCRVTKIN